ncbi:MAG: BMP family lipoprotein [Bacteroidota bacterium]
MRRKIAVFGVLVLVLSLMVSLSGAGAAKLRFAMVTDIGGLGDQSFNDSAYAGLKRAEKELGAEIKVLQSKKMEDYVPNLRSLAEQKYDLIWAVGFLMTDATNEVAAQYPKINFGIIDSVVNQPNVQSVCFKEHEGSFLVGVIAAMTTKTKVVGFVGGMKLPLIEKFEAGFTAGVRAVDPKIRVLSAYTGKFDDPGKGKELAMAQFGQKADVVYHASGACGIGVIEAAKEKNLWAIGVDSDQYHLAPKNVLTSMMKRVDVGVFSGCRDVAKNAFKGGRTVVLGLAEEGVGYAPTTEKNASKEAIAKADEFAKLIVSGKLVVPEKMADVR